MPNRAVGGWALDPAIPSCFKAYDVRGRVPDELDEQTAYRIGRAFVSTVPARRVAVGRDMRLSSPQIAQALSEGLAEGGADVLDIGLCGTELVYFATAHLDADGGIMVTASHNPADYNGMKFVRAGAAPISGDSGLHEIGAKAARGDFAKADRRGRIESVEVLPAYVEHLLTYVDPDVLKPLRIACNPGNGAAGLVLRELAPRLPFEFITIHDEPDGAFPNGVPNPMLPERRADTERLVKESGADFGVAWDGDFDRCFFFDGDGEFIDGYYLVGLFAEAILKERPGGGIIHDPRLTWNTVEIVEQAGGKPIVCKTGHAFIKEKMRATGAVYGGEMSAHHYFHSFHACDSGMIPWLLLSGILSEPGGPDLSERIAVRKERFPISGEINRELADPDGAVSLVERLYKPDAAHVDRTDGLSVEFDRWRFNLRKSNTEPVVRLNVESRADRDLLQEKTAQLLSHLEGR